MSTKLTAANTPYHRFVEHATPATPASTFSYLYADTNGVFSSINDAGLAAPYSRITSGAGAPGTTPTYVGEIYIDTTGDDFYLACGVASAADWKSGGGLASLNHNDTLNIQGGAVGDYYHLTGATVTDLTDGGATTLHKHDHGLDDGLTDDDHIRYADTTSQAGIPVSTPTRVGNINTNTTSDLNFIAAGVASVADWKLATSPICKLLVASYTADVASVTFTGWPVCPEGTYKKFIICGNGIRTDRAAVSDLIAVSFNGDTTATNYDDKTAFTNTATTWSVSEDIGSLGHITCGRIAGTSIDNNFFASADIEIYSPEDTTIYKMCQARSVLTSATAAELMLFMGGGVWESTAAITSINIAPSVGTTFVVGGAGEPALLEFTLYGVL